MAIAYAIPRPTATGLYMATAYRELEIVARNCDLLVPGAGWPILGKAVHREGRQGREGRQSTSLVIKITNLVITSGFILPLISLAFLASLAVQMLDLGS